MTKNSHKDDAKRDDHSSDPLVDALKKAQAKAEESKQAEDEKLSGSASAELKLRTQLEQMKQTAQRAVADLANFRRRAEEERMQIVNFANADLLKSVIPSLDNFERAMNHLPTTEDELAKNWIEGITQTFKQLQDNLANKGLTRIQTVGEQFDPNHHEALLQGPGEKDKVTEELEAGYMLGERVIRAAKVKVGNGEKDSN